MRSLKRVVSVCVLVCGVVPASAAVLTFIPPNDPTGTVYSNTNDSFNYGRGIQFTMSADTTIDSIGTNLYLKNILLSYAIREPLPGDYWWSWDTGTRTINNTSLQWIDFPITPLTLKKDHTYQIDFSFEGSAQRIPMYNNEVFNVGAFTAIEAEHYFGYAVTTELSAVRVNVVPEPTGVWAAVAVVGLLRRRRHPSCIFHTA